MEFQIDNERVITALTSRVADLVREVATLTALVQTLSEEHAQCGESADGR